jgi:hypothetical protein
VWHALRGKVGLAGAICRVVYPLCGRRLLVEAAIRSADRRRQVSNLTGAYGGLRSAISAAAARPRPFVGCVTGR